MNMVLTLLVITLVASLALGSIYNLTKEPIELAKKAKLENAIKQVIPEFDSLKTIKVLPKDGSPDSVTIYEGFKSGQKVGSAVATYSNKGFDATQIQIMVGFLPDNKIQDIAIVQQKETPGLGTKMKEPKFKDQFKGIDPSKFIFKVKKDGGDVDAITAATISSRAVSDAMQRAYDAYKMEGGNNQ